MKRNKSYWNHEPPVGATATKELLRNDIDLFNPVWKPDVGCVFGDMMVVRKGGAQKLVDVRLEVPQIA